MMAVLSLLWLSLVDAKPPEPLVVVVEASAVEVVKASSVRTAIAHELRARVLSPAEDESADGAPIMTVVLASDRAVVTYRHLNTTIRRDIELPPDGQQRLQLVAWLAGNIVRDQTTELLRGPTGESATETSPGVELQRPPEESAATPPPPTRTVPAAATSPPSTPTGPASSPQPGPPGWAATQTPAASPLSRAGDGGGAGPAHAPPRIVASSNAWTVAAMIGRGILDVDRITCNCGPFFSDLGGQTELEVMRSGPSFAIGGTYFKARGEAWAVTLGWHHLPTPWLAAEVRATLGIWAMGDATLHDTTDLFARLAGGLAASPTSWLDIVARVSVITPMSTNQYLAYASVGLRYRLPL